jgi:hypothetical protein
LAQPAQLNQVISARVDRFDRSVGQTRPTTDDLTPAPSSRSSRRLLWLRRDPAIPVLSSTGEVSSRPPQRALQLYLARFVPPGLYRAPQLRKPGASSAGSGWLGQVRHLRLPVRLAKNLSIKHRRPEAPLQQLVTSSMANPSRSDSSLPVRLRPPRLRSCSSTTPASPHCQLQKHCELPLKPSPLALCIWMCNMILLLLDAS